LTPDHHGEGAWQIPAEWQPVGSDHHFGSHVKTEANMKLNIGIFVDCLRRPIPEGLRLAAEMKVQSFQVYVTKGEMLAANMNRRTRADFVKRYKDLGLELSATCGDFGLNFGDDAALKAKEPMLMDAVIQTAELESAIMTTHIGALGDDPSGAKEGVMVANLKRLGDFAARHGVTLATETGLESGATLRRILERAETKGLGVNYDPANLLMRGIDYLAAIRELSPFIVHTHAKDGVRREGKGREMPLGEGDVNFPVYVGLLTSLGYRGAYTIEREVGEDAAGDIRKAVSFLRRLKPVSPNEASAAKGTK
jgi:sugar phosphate isomerase/epimerase